MLKLHWLITFFFRTDLQKTNLCFLWYRPGFSMSKHSNPFLSIFPSHIFETSPYWDSSLYLITYHLLFLLNYFAKAHWSYHGSELILKQIRILHLDEGSFLMSSLLKTQEVCWDHPRNHVLSHFEKIIT